MEILGSNCSGQLSQARVVGGGVAILLFTSYYRNRPIKVPAEWGRLLSLWLVWLLFDLFLCF